MRPHRLRVSAFGPFADSVEIDFDALSGSGLFLLHGDTGAGKTTLLDAMGFALYGRVPGVRNDAKRLRSDHADAEAHTEVQLEATLGGRRIRITRSPEYQRPKRRGGGTTKQSAKVLLEEQVGGTWTTVSTSHREADDVVLDLVGMSAEQFFQVVLLPQGEFAKFLRADSAARAQLLEKLFGTGLYRSAEEWLVGCRIATSRAVEVARAEVGLATARVALAAGVVEPAEPDPAWAVDVLRASERDLAASEQAVASLSTGRDRARVTAEAARQLAAAQARRSALLTTQGLLAERAVPVAALREELVAAGRAAEVAAVLGQVQARTTETAAADQTLRAARTRLAAVGLEPDLDVDVLAAKVDDIRTRIGRLEGLRPLAAEIDHDDATARSARAAQQEAEASIRRLGAQLTQGPARRAAGMAAVEAARAATLRLPVLTSRRDVLTSLLVDAGLVAAKTAEAVQLREEILLAREKALSLRDKAADVREARLEDIRFELASMLVDDAPCPVCGSLFHPDPSEVRGERVTRDDEDTARAHAEVAQREVEELSARLAATDAERQALAARVGDGTPATLAAELQVIATEIATVGPLAETVAHAEAAVEAIDAEQGQLETERATAKVTAVEAQRRAAEAEARAAGGRVRLAAELGGADDLDDAVDRATAVVAAAESVLEAEAALVRAEAERSGAELAAAEAAGRAGFDGVGEAAAAVRLPSWRAATQEELRSYDDERAATEAALSDPALDVPFTPPADVAGTTAAVVAADAALDAATAAGATAASRAASLGELVPALTTLLDQLSPLVEEARRVRALADLCGGAGANALRMTLSSFVLAARLEEVAAAASERLLRMTQGRYTLVHTDGTARGGARSGLGLLARDTWTGQDRDTGTLSGGETFLASLALALGLTDVVTAESGGSRIEALFVDEGFGTLDEDTLDEVMDVLDGLREGGRIVGLVSHVAELRQRIPAQVHVRKGRTGSTAVVLAG